MYLGLIDYIVLILLLILSCGTGIYRGYSRSQQVSSKQFLIADGQMKIIPTAMSLLATLKSPASLLGMPVEFYYYGTMLIYCNIVNFDPSIRYTMWNIFISVIFSSTAQYACIQTQAQRYMPAKDTKFAQKVVWTNYVMLVFMHILSLCIRCLLYNKYSQCDPFQPKLFLDEINLSIACMLNATLSTFSSGTNSMATVILEDISKQLTKKHSM
ncbi:unnamed protein product [Adineta steineri]|uniref:Uncharacterized protein n=1 Tax=Adineta steineri TaxID=433720 RepID=A0A818US77_9BILA|nr:unnamed protein product [Adineta steineri]